MQAHHEADVADLCRHVAADPLPGVARPLESIDATMVLLVEDVGLTRVHLHAVRIVLRADFLPVERRGW